MPSRFTAGLAFLPQLIAFILRALAYLIDPAEPPPWATVREIKRLPKRRHNDRR